MSIRIMTNVWDEAPQDGTNLLVLLALADSASDEGYCWPSIETLSHKCRRSERVTQRAIAELSERGAIEIIRRSGRSNVFRFVKYLAAARGDAHDTLGVTPTTPGGDAHDTLGVTPTTPRTVTVTVIESEEAPNGAVADATRSKTSRSKPQPTTPKQHPDTPAVLALYRDALGYALPSGAADAKAASWMLEQGYTESQIMAAYWAMKREEFWSVRRLSLQSVKGQIGEFSRRNGTANGRNAGPSLDAMIAAEGAEWGDPSTWSDELRRQFPDAAARRAAALNGAVHA